MPATLLTTDLSSAAGVQWQFQPEGRKFKAIDVPAGGWVAQGFNCQAGVYRARVPVPKAARGKVLRLAFEAVNFGAEVYVGPDEDHLVNVASHVGGWMPIVCEITDAVADLSEFLLVVEVAGRGKFLRDGKITLGDAAPWQPKLADGILRGVELQALPELFIDDVFVRTSVARDRLTGQAVLVNRTGRRVEVTLTAKLASASGSKFKYPKLSERTATLEPGESRPVSLPETGWGLGPASYWWPNVPYRQGYRAELHELELTAGIDGQTVHKATRRFGFREFTTAGCHYYLNGIKTNLRGDNQQEANFGTDAYGTHPGFARPTKDNPGWPKAVDNLLRLNFNVLRIHQVPATPYMLDVCDELGLMIVDETPVRGSENHADFAAGREHMLTAFSDLVRRDRNHPSIVLWSAANEIWKQRGLALALIAAGRAEDDTRVIIIDGEGDLGPEIINMQHYVGGCGVPPVYGGQRRADRPYGETESVWPSDNSWQGFAWMATCTRIRRWKGNADIRNYVLNNAWSNYVPGQSPAQQDLEKKIKDIRWEQCVSDYKVNPPIRDPWNHRCIQLMQQCFHPLTVCDVEFDEANYISDEKGKWPVVAPELPAGQTVTRNLAVFNDEFAGEEITVRWAVNVTRPSGRTHERGQFTLRVPLGEHVVRPIEFTTPERPCKLHLVTEAIKDGKTRFSEDRHAFAVKADR